MPEVTLIMSGDEFLSLVFEKILRSVKLVPMISSWGFRNLLIVHNGQDQSSILEVEGP